MDQKEVFDNSDREQPAYQVSAQTSGNKAMTRGRAITSMALGISSVSLWFYPFITSIPCIVLGIVAMVLSRSNDGIENPRFRGFTKAGRITGLVGTIVASVYTVVFLIVVIVAATRR